MLRPPALPLDDMLSIEPVPTVRLPGPDVPPMPGDGFPPLRIAELRDLCDIDLLRRLAQSFQTQNTIRADTRQTV
jgi:hypothetical protein